MDVFIQRRGRDSNIILSKHPSGVLRKGRVNLKQKRLPLRGETFLGGEGGIRTREPLWVTRFPSVRAKPDYATSPNIKRRDYTRIYLKRNL